MQRPQHFQREVDRERVMALMKPFGEDAAARELLNITGRAQTEPAFARDWIEPLRDRATDWASVPGMDYPRFFVALDPAGEGFSQNVLVSAYMDATTRPNGAPYTVVVRSLSLLLCVRLFIHVAGRRCQHPRGAVPATPWQRRPPRPPGAVGGAAPRPRGCPRAPRARPRP